jgi:hypothetical protein
MRYFRLLLDVIDRESDVMCDAVPLDDGPANSVLATLIERVCHRRDGLERVALCTTRRRDVGLAAGHSDAIVEYAVDGLGRNAWPVVLDDDRVVLHIDPDCRRDLGPFAGIQRVVDGLL